MTIGGDSRVRFMNRQCYGLIGQMSFGSVDKIDENDSIVEEISFYTRDLKVIAA